MTSRWRKLLMRSWLLSRCYYGAHGVPLRGRPSDLVWYFAYGANMHDSAFQGRRGMRPLAWRPGYINAYRLRFNLDGKPQGKAAPANIAPQSKSQVWGVLYKVTRRDLLRLDATEGVPGRRYQRLWLVAQDALGAPLIAMTYIAQGKEADGAPSLRYLTLLREGAQAHGLPQRWLDLLENVRPAE